MKRITLLAAIVLLCVGSLAFADTATVALTGAVEAGAKIVLGANSTIQQYTNNEGTTGWANMNLTATLGDMSANFYLRSSDFATWIIPNAWVTEKLFNKMLELRAGNIDNAATATAYEGWGGLSGIGIQAVVNPIAGLSVGVLVPAPLVAADLATTLGKFAVGAAYSIPNLANIALTYRAGVDFDAGVNVTAVKNLTLELETLIPLIDSPTIQIVENVSYAMTPITVTLTALEKLPTGAALDMTITPYVNYVMDIVTLWAQVAYTLSTSTVAPEVGVAFAWNGMGTFKVYWDGSFAGSTSTNAIELNFIHNF